MSNNLYAESLQLSMSKIDPKLLQVFVDVINQGSFTRAADLRETDSSYVTRQIKRLESCLGVKLLNRSTRAISLTDKGSEIYRHAAQLNELIQNIENVADRGADEFSGHLKITSSIYLGKKFLLPTVEKICDKYPKISIEVHLSDEQVDVIKERYDLALRVWKPKSVDLIAKHLLDIRFLLVASPEFVEAYGMPKSIEELSELPAIAYGRKGHTNKAVTYIDIDGKLRSFRLSANLCVNDDSDVEKYGNHGKRYFLATNYMVAKSLQEGKLIQLLPEVTFPLDASVSVMYPNRSLPAAAQLIIQELKKSLEEYKMR